MRFEVLTTVKINIVVFWVVALCSVVDCMDTNISHILPPSSGYKMDTHLTEYMVSFQKIMWLNSHHIQLQNPRILSFKTRCTDSNFWEAGELKLHSNKINREQRMASPWSSHKSSMEPRKPSVFFIWPYYGPLITDLSRSFLFFFFLWISPLPLIFSCFTHVYVLSSYSFHLHLKQ